MKSSAYTRLRRLRLGRDERGQGLVEFALILPFFLLLLVGMIEFGSVYSKVISMRQGVREAGRHGSVASFGSSTCPLTFSGPAPSANIQKLICLTKSQTEVGDVVQVRVRFENANLTPGSVTEGTTPGTSLYDVGNAILVCSVYPLQSLTGIFQPLLNPHYAKTKAAFRIESLSTLDGATGQGGQGKEWGGGEPDPSGGNWSWCA